MQQNAGKLEKVDHPTLGPTTYPKRHIFLDIDNLTEWGLGIYQRFPQPECMPTTGLEPGPVHGWDARLTSAWGSVLNEEGRYRLWGCAMPQIHDLGERSDIWLAMYAESEDGIHWRKPDLGITLQDRWPGNNLIKLPWSVLSVTRALSGTGYRYVALVNQSLPPYPGVFSDDSEVFNGAGVYFFGSDDGLDWVQITKNPVLRHGDVVTLHADHLRHRYLMYAKVGAIHGLTPRRSWIVLESTDLINWEGYHGYRQWNEAFVSDDYDDLLALQHGYRIGEYNGMAFHQIDTMYLALEAFFMMSLPLKRHAAQNPAGVMALRLAFSHNGMKWRYPAGRPLFIENPPPGEFGAGYFASASNILDVGDDTLHYYTAFKRQHGWGCNEDQTLDTAIPANAQNGQAHLFVAKMKRDRYASLASTYRDTFDVEIGLRQGRELTFNGITRGNGTIRVAIAEQSYPLHLEPRKNDSLPGFSFDDCIPFSGNEVWAPVRFKQRSVTEIPMDMALILRFELDGAEVFGYEWHESLPA